jgi:hypothetical protein
MTIAAAFAELERDRIRERITQVKRDQKARGRFLGGTRPPFGFRAGSGGELVPHEAEQAAIAQAKRMAFPLNACCHREMETDSDHPPADRHRWGYSFSGVGNPTTGRLSRAGARGILGASTLGAGFRS